jgi:hypothetical protein
MTNKTKKNDPSFPDNPVKKGDIIYFIAVLLSGILTAVLSNLAYNSIQDSCLSGDIIIGLSTLMVLSVVMIGFVLSYFLCVWQLQCYTDLKTRQEGNPTLAELFVQATKRKTTYIILSAVFTLLIVGISVFVIIRNNANTSNNVDQDNLPISCTSSSIKVMMIINIITTVLFLVGGAIFLAVK